MADDTFRVILNVFQDPPISLFLIIFSLFLCWGSFLNVAAFRLLYKKPFFAKRSYCPGCKSTIAWFDLIPVISWLLLKGHCRWCSASISWLYPLIELLTGILFTLLMLSTPPLYWVSYGLFFSALIITIRTDLESMMILRFCSLGLIPLGLVFSYLGYLPITVTHSTLGAFFGYSILWLVRTLFWYLHKQEGLGEGDLELLAGIGAFTGLSGVWYTLLYGSIAGSILGIILSILLKKKIEKLPFGPFLALGALIVVLLP